MDSFLSILGVSPPFSRFSRELTYFAKFAVENEGLLVVYTNIS